MFAKVSQLRQIWSHCQWSSIRFSLLLWDVESGKSNSLKILTKNFFCPELNAEWKSLMQFPSNNVVFFFSMQQQQQRRRRIKKFSILKICSEAWTNYRTRIHKFVLFIFASHVPLLYHHCDAKWRNCITVPQMWLLLK